MRSLIVFSSSCLAIICSLAFFNTSASSLTISVSGVEASGSSKQPPSFLVHFDDPQHGESHPSFSGALAAVQVLLPLPQKRQRAARRLDHTLPPRIQAVGP